jgi:hypothetical protein
VIDFISLIVWMLQVCLLIKMGAVLVRIFVQCLIHFGFTGLVYCRRIQLEET